MVARATTAWWCNNGVCSLPFVWSHTSSGKGCTCQIIVYPGQRNRSRCIDDHSLLSILLARCMCCYRWFCHISTHWGRVTHICVSKLTIIASDNGLSPGRRQIIIWNNAGILLIWPLGTGFSEILIEIHSFSFNKKHLKMSSGKWRPFWFCHMLTHWPLVTHVMDKVHGHFL